MKYRSYRNKLTSILRKIEKQYYNQLLIEQKGNVKNIWKILNTIIRKPKNSHNYPDAFVDKGNFITDKNEMVNKFNEYFVDVGIELANNIAPPNQHVSVHFLSKILLPWLIRAKVKHHATLTVLI